MEEKKKSKKGTIITIVVLIVLILGLGGYIVYDKFLKEEPKQEPKAEVVEQVKEVEFCSAENLVENHYLTKVEGTNYKYRSNKTLIEIRDGKVFAQNEKEKLIELQGIEGTPKSVGSFYDFESQLPEHFVLTENGDLYYININNEIGKSSLTMKKINTEKVVDLYASYTVKLSDAKYVDILNGFYAELEDGKLINIASGKFEVGNENSFCTYPDRIGGFGGYNAFYISVEKKLFIPPKGENNTTYKEVTYNNNSIIVKDIFATVDEKTSKPIYYVITQDNKILKVSEKGSVTLYTEKEVKEYKYEIGELTNKLIITYADGTNETTEISQTSTIYYRNMQ